MPATMPEMTAPELNNGSLREPISANLLGTAVLDKSGAFDAGSYQSFTLTYTAGRFGIDDSGSLRIAFRFATDQSNPQFVDGTAPNFTQVEASNNAILEARFDPKGNIRPWDRTLQIKVVKGFMKEGDTITVRFGVTDQGSPGMRLQTFCESRFEFRVLVDPIATYNFQTLPDQPAIQIAPGEPENWGRGCAHCQCYRQAVHAEGEGRRHLGQSDKQSADAVVSKIRLRPVEFARAYRLYPG